VAEQFPGGAGKTWKASVWIAAQKASMVVGRELIDYAFYAKSEGFIDGPSAGALFTAGFMAAIMGDEVNPKASMTGTVNPDGTVGMVGGLEHKFRAAIKKGKKILGYPEGNKRFKNEKGLLIDLEDLAAEHGAPNFAIRRFTLEPGATVPRHTNAVEHEQYVLSGEYVVGIDDEEYEVGPGDSMLIPAGVVHWYRNESDEPGAFICAVPNGDDSIELLE